MGGILVLGGGGIYVMRRILSKANAQYVLRTTRGPVHLTEVSLRGRRSHGLTYKQYQMQIRDVPFVLNDELVGKIKEGEDYAVYYLDYQDGSEGIIQSLERFG